MTIYPISSAFVVAHAGMTWSDILHGYDRQYVGWTCPVEMAKRRVGQGIANAVERELAAVEKSNAFRAGELLRELASVERDRTPTSSSEKWLYLSLAWIYENRDAFVDPLAHVETVYADFDYPEQIESFVRYMPPTDGFDPSQHTAEECIDRLLENWTRYLAQSRVLESRESEDK